MDMNNFNRGFSKAFNLFSNELRDFHITIPSKSDQEAILNDWQAVENEIKTATESILQDKNE